MARVILFGGGDGGGLVIGPNGVRPIPPFDPALRLQLQAITRLLRAERGLGDEEVQRQLAGSINRLANLAVGQVEGAVGPLDEDAGLVYQDEDGGFTCGSTGQPPIPFPWPPEPGPAVDELIQRGMLNRDAVRFVQRAAIAGADLGELLRDPASAAKGAGIELTPAAEEGVRALNLGDPGAIEDPVDREVVELFHRAAAEGEHLDLFATQPMEVARRVGVDLSEAAADRIIAAATPSLGRRDPSVAMSPYGVAIVVVIVIVVWTREARIPVIDESGLEKF